MDTAAMLFCSSFENVISSVAIEQYRKKMHVEASTQITHPFVEAENKTLLLFVNVKQEKYDSSSKQVEIIGFSVFNILCFL
jgi:hypothetical protein